MTITAMARTGSHHIASLKNRRIGIATGAENGTYDMTVMAKGLSPRKITRKYGIIVRYITGVSVEPASSWRETNEPAAANIAASSTKPNRKNTANQMIEIGR